MKCHECGRNFRKQQMTLEAYNRMFWRKTTNRIGGNVTIMRTCDSCARRK